MKVLEVKNITKIYKIYKSNLDRLKEIFTNKIYHREFIANHNISFELNEKETLGIIGVNGAGKSTILKIIAGVITPTSGHIVKRGKVTALLELGTGFNQEFSGYDNIYLNGTLIGMSKKNIDKNVKDIIDFSELEEHIYEPIKTYSSGMKMRLAFSIAIFSEPRILIVDEALSVGDAHFSAKCTRALRERKARNMSIIYVSHNLNSLKLLCDRVVLLDKGTIKQEGNPEDVVNNYNYLISKLNEKKDKIINAPKCESSFGTFDIEIFKVTIFGRASNSDIISAGEDATISIYISAKKDLQDMTIGILIKDRFGQDIFGTNTFLYHQAINFKKDTQYICTFDMPLNIGVGKYSITAAVHSKDTHLENCSHWLDYASDFEVAGIVGNQFIGLSKLEPTIKLDEVKND